MLKYATNVSISHSHNNDRIPIIQNVVIVFRPLSVSISSVVQSSSKINDEIPSSGLQATSERPVHALEACTSSIVLHKT